jgi:hypothetical protein
MSIPFGESSLHAEIKKNFNLGMIVGKLFEKGLTLGTGQCNVKVRL